MTERRGVEIDYCSRCRGVWLDRGELDKIIRQVEGEAPRGPAPYSERGGSAAGPGIGDLVREALDAYRRRDSDRRYDDRGNRRRRSGLRDLFDF